MSKILIIITLTYPYDTGNNFLANEYDAINDNYDEIIVFCLAAPQNKVLAHKLSDKWQVFYKTEVQNGFARKIKYLFLGIRYLNNSDLKTELNEAKTLFQKLVAVYYYGRLMHCEKFINDNIPKIPLEKDDQIIIYSFWFLQTANCAALLKKYFNKRVECKIIAVSRAHGYDLYEYRNKANYLPFRKTVMENLDMIYPCSKNGEIYLAEKYSNYSDKIKCSYLGSFDHGINSLSQNKIFTIVTCSNIISVKRVGLLAEALLELEEQGITDIQWICIGDGDLKQEVMHYCRENIKLIKVQFLGYIPNKEVFELYKKQRVDAFLNTSSSEGLPVSIMEAQSQGIPVIATDVGGTSEIVNSDNGVLLSHNPSPREIAEAILFVKNMSNEVVESLRVINRNNWEKNFNARHNYQKFHNTLSKLNV